MATAFSPRFFLPTAPTDPYMDLTPEELAQERISRAYRSASERGPVAAMLAAAQAMKEHYPAQSDAAPEPATVSGGSVIGLMPEQTTALLDRVQRQNEIDRRMYEARQSDLRQQAQAREGYIFRARDAEANRQQRAAIEDARIKQKQAAEAEKLTRGTIDALPGQPGFGLQRRMNPDTGQMEASVVQLQGADALPEKKPTPRWAQVQGPEGPVWADLNNQSPDAPTMPVAVPQITPAQKAQMDAAKQARELRLSEQLSKIPPEAMSDDEKVKALKQFHDSGEVPLIDYVDKSHKHYQTDADGNLFVDGVKQNPEGWQTKPDKESKEKISEDLLRIAFKDSWNNPDKSTQEKVNYLWAHNKSPEEIARVLGPPTEPGALWGTNERYVIPSTKPTEGISSGGKEILKYNPETGGFD